MLQFRFLNIAFAILYVCMVMQIKLVVVVVVVYILRF